MQKTRLFIPIHQGTLFHFRHDLEVTAPSVNVSNEAKTCGNLSQAKNQVFTINRNDSEASVLKATVVHGSAQVECQNWFSTLGIKLSGK